MKDIFIVMSFTIRELVKRKSFIISTIFLLAAIIIGFNVPKIISAIKGEDDTSSKIVIYAEDEEYKEFVDTIVIPESETIIAENMDEAKEKINSDECDYGFKISKAEAPYNIKITYLIKNGGALTEIPQTMVQMLQNT